MGKEEKVEEVEVISEEKLVEVKKEKKKKNKKDKKPMNIFVLFFLMIIAFAIEEVFTLLGGSAISESMKIGRYGFEAIHEMGAAIIIVFIVIICGHRKVFTEKRESFWNSIKVAMPFFLMALMLTVVKAMSLKSFHLGNLISLIVFVFFVGIYEELLCRGWLLNTFLKRRNKKYGQVILSIVLSALIFGCMHFLNILSGQTVFATLMQVFQTTAMGFLLGGIYYRTKNIYSVMFLHGFFDFGVMIGEMNMLRDCTTGEATRAIAIYEAISSACIALMYIIWGAYILRREKVYPLLDEPKEHKTSPVFKPLAIVLSLVLFFGTGFIKQPKGYDTYQTCYDYETIELGVSELHYPQGTVYEFGENGFAYKLELEKKELILTNTGTKEKITLFKDTLGFVIVKETEGFIIVAIDSDAHGNEKVNYTKIIPSMYSDDKDFLTTIKDSFNSYVIPDSERLGYLTNSGTDYVYPLIDVRQENQFVIDENGKLKLVKFTNKENEKKEKPVEVLPDETVKEAVDPMAVSEEIVGSGITNEEIQQVVEQNSTGAEVE